MTGSLQKVKNRRGELVWRAQWREHGRGRTRILGTVREMGRGAAKEALRAIVAPFAAKQPGGAVTFASFVNGEYIPSRSLIWKRSTESTTVDLIERHILPRIGERLLTTITRRELQDLLTELAAAGLSASVVNHVRFQLKAIFELAAGDGAIVVNPTNGLKTPKGVKERRAPELGAPEKLAQAMMALGVRDRLFVALAAWRGMRPGEIAALRVGDIQDGQIIVSRRVYMGVIDQPKSRRGLREIPIGTLAGLIAEHIGTLPDQRPDAWLFPSETGSTPIAYKNLYQRRLQPVLEAAGLTRFNFQAMRATYATDSADVEPDAKVRADLMGHTVAVHEQVYRQSTQKQRQELIQRMDRERLQ